MEQKEMGVIEHLEELRKRLIIIFTAVMTASLIAYGKIMFLIEIVMKPLANYEYELVFMSVTEGFIIRFKLAVFVGIIFMSPVIFYQIIAFISPGLTKRERLLLYSSIFFLSTFFIFGTVFGYILILPDTLDFLINYSKSYMTPILSGSMYLGFIGAFCLVTGIICIIPLLIIILGKVGIINSKNLRKSRKYVILIMLAIELSFIPTTDVITVAVVILPITLLYELAIWIVYFIERGIKK